MSPLSVWTPVARRLWMLAAGAALLCGAQKLLGFGGPALQWIADPWAASVIMALCAAAVAARAVAQPSERVALGVLAVGIGLYALAQPSSARFASDPHSPSSLEQVLGAAIYPAALVTLALLARARSRRLRWEHWLDGAVGGLSAAALGAILVFRLFVDAAQMPVSAEYVIATLGDLVVIGFGLGSYVMLGWRPSRAVRALILGFGLLIVADVGYLDGLAAGGASPAVWLESFWLLAMLTIAGVSMVPPLASTPPPSRPPHRTLSVYALVSAVLALGVVVWQRPQDLGSTLSVTLAGLAIIAILVRLSLTLRARARLISALATSEARLARAQRLAGVGSWEWNAIDDRLSVSDYQLHLHGWTGPEPPGLEASIGLVHEGDRRRVIDVMHDAWTNEQGVELEYRAAGGDEPRVIRLQGQPLRDGGGRVVGLLGTSQDVTERVRRTEAERANHAKSEFLSRMSHELRTPLNAVLGFGQLLSTSQLSDRQRTNVDQILTAGNHLLSLINEVLDVSRIEAGRMAVSVEPVALAGALDEAVAMIEPLARERRITVVNRPTGAAPWVQADQQRLKQVLLNLLSNAVKYNREGGSVDVSVTPAPGGRVRVAITDTGLGMTEDEIKQAFQPFERLGADLRGVEGTGLGLAVTAGLLDAMGAGIDVTSSPGEGSTFAIDLQAAEPVQLPDEPLDEPFPTTAVATEHTVLCIEDNPSNLNLIAQIFERRPSIRLLTTTHGIDGLALARIHRPELVLLDLDLPDIGGEQVLEHLRGDLATAGIPVAILTAHARPEQRQVLLDAGAHAYLTKPLDIAALLELVDGTLLEASVR